MSGGSCARLRVIPVTAEPPLTCQRFVTYRLERGDTMSDMVKMSSPIKVDYSDYRANMETARERLEKWIASPEAPDSFTKALERVKVSLEATAEEVPEPTSR